MDAPGRAFAWWRLVLVVAAAGSLALGGYFLSLPYHHHRGEAAVVAGLFLLVSAWRPPRARKM